MPELWDLYDAQRNLTGRTVDRAQPFRPYLPGETKYYHLVVHVWLVNSRGEFLIDQRSPEKHMFPLMWETCGGSALAGEDSLTAALREFREEIGIALLPERGERVLTFRRDEGHYDFLDIWLFRQDVGLADFVPQPGETVQARFATPEEILRMIDAGEFCHATYIQELFEIARSKA